MKLFKIPTLLLAVFAVFVGLSLAQDAPAPDTTQPTVTPAPPPEPIVEIEAADGLTLSGVYYDPGGDRPAVVLLHQMYASRGSWADLIQPLLDGGFKVLILDLRGFGDTRGRINWGRAQEDTVKWVEWLRGQPGVTSVSLMGSSIGSALALAGCAQIEDCAGAVAISPGLNYYDVWTGDAVAAGFPILIVYADRDRYPSLDVPRMLELAVEKLGNSDHITVQTYAGRDHGMALFTAHEELIGSVVEWLK